MSILDQYPPQMGLRDVLAQYRGGGSPPFRPPDMNPSMPGMPGGNMTNDPRYGGGKSGGAPPILPPTPMPPTPMPPTPAPSGGGVGIGGQGGSWVDAGYGQGPMNAHGMQWSPNGGGQPSAPQTPSLNLLGGSHPGGVAPPGQMTPPAPGSDQRPTPTMLPPTGGTGPRMTPPGQMYPPSMKPGGDLRLQQVVGARRPGKY